MSSAYAGCRSENLLIISSSIRYPVISKVAEARSGVPLENALQMNHKSVPRHSGARYPAIYAIGVSL